MNIALIVLAASVFCPCGGQNAALRWNLNATESDSETTAETQRRIFGLVDAGAWTAALEEARFAITRDSRVWGPDHYVVVFDYALLALVQKAQGHERDARETALGLFSIPPATPLFRYSDPAEVVRLVQIALDTDHRDHNDDNLYRTLLDLLEPAGPDANGARAALYFWMGVQAKSSAFNYGADDQFRLDHLAKAQRFLHTSLTIAERAYGTDCPRLAGCLNHLAIVEAELCRFDVARQLFTRAINLALHGCEGDVTEISRYLENYRALLAERGLRDEANFAGTLESEARYWQLHIVPVRR